MTSAVAIRGLSKNYGALKALDSVDLEVRAGEFFGLLGPNGAGKTTLISILAGLARANAGEAKILGHDVVRDFRAARRVLGVVPQELVFDPFFTVRETLRFQSGYFGITDNRAWIEELLANLDLQDKADTNMRALSGGMKRRVLVAQALVHKPPVIVLDEPTAGVDVELRQTLWAFIKQLNADGHTVILTTHYLEEAQALCGRIAMLKQGRIVAHDTMSRLLERFRALSAHLRAATLPESWASQASARRGDVWTVPLGDYADLERLLADCRLAGIAITDLRLEATDLEDVFMKIMETH